jgi:hypothetical protein
MTQQTNSWKQTNECVAPVESKARLKIQASPNPNSKNTKTKEIERERHRERERERERENRDQIVTKENLLKGGLCFFTTFIVVWSYK